MSMCLHEISDFTDIASLNNVTQPFNQELIKDTPR